MADSEEKLCQLVEEPGRVRKRNLRVIANKSKIMRCTRGMGGKRIKVAMNGELLEKVNLL